MNHGSYKFQTRNIDSVKNHIKMASCRLILQHTMEIRHCNSVNRLEKENEALTP